jgi:hypothetical protein
MWYILSPICYHHLGRDSHRLTERNSDILNREDLIAFMPITTFDIPKIQALLLTA